MGAGTPENGFWPGATTPDLCLVAQGMNATTHTVNESDGTTRRIGPGRFARACTEAIETTATALFQYDVTHDGETYVVDVQVGHCGCKDHESRGDELVCKHQCAAAIRHCYRDVRNTELVARVLRHAQSTGCPHGYAGCPGPTGPGLPCEDCIRSISAGHWTVWQHTERTMRGDATVDRGEGVATDGGQTAADAENAALDDEAVRLLGNAKTVFWDIPEHALSKRERNRLSTIQKKTDELEQMVRDRKRNEAMDGGQEAGR